ncbi:fructosamine kinase family protein [Carboxylicivirga linearis]|uniref:Fructosamine kinase family protein n=1 Tax=Carboxylicivirga linearis TaxID=1628157 RepID=A0ABS5JZ89_9BACT|nr:fructosamine kinase family protein [Carboxylicivirga linearis]MBS2100222.1 fructosamine kinase family protein [Carboxylicivirga linearis]
MPDLISKIEDILQTTIVKHQSVGGGCIAQTQVIKTDDGHNYFLKAGFNNSMFRNEANGLKELSKAGCIRIPKVLAVGDDFLLLENIEQGSKSKHFFDDFGKAFAQMHRFTSDNFGFYEDNFIGSTPQLNIPETSESTNWTNFYFNKRLKYQFLLCEKNGYSDEGFKRLFAGIEKNISHILSGSKEAPSLLHGDLWGGNYMVDTNHKAVLIDPGVYYGHREADLAMTKLFGGFSPQFYQSYNQTYPLKEGYEYRQNIYLLYHVLNHLNLFGYSYKSQAEQLMRSYL